MKKRLLSAALALAMVLTMLPLTAFAASASVTEQAASENDPGNGKTTVSINTEGKASWSYVDAADGNKTKKAENKDLKSGVIVANRTTKGAAYSGIYYTSFENAMNHKTGNSSFVLLGDVSGASSLLTRNITVDVNGHSFGVGTFSTDAQTGTTSKSVTQLTFRDCGDNAGTATGGSVTGSISVSGKSFTVNLTDVKGSSSALTVTLDNSSSTATTQYTLRVTAKDSKLGAITAKNANVYVDLTNSEAGAVKVGDSAAIGNDRTDSNTVRLNNSTVDSIQLNGYSGGSSVSLSNRAEVTGTVSLYGQNTLTLNGMSSIEDSTTLYGGKEGDNTASATTTPAWKTTVTVDGTSTMGAIAQASDDENGHRIDIKGGSTVASIDLSKGGTSDIDIVSSKLGDNGTGTLAIARGTVDIKNSAVGNITAGKDGETGAVAVTIGTQNQADTSKVGNVTKVATTNVATPSVKLYSGEVGDISATSHEVYGGKVGSKVAKANLKNGLADGFQIALGASGTAPYLYTTKFQDLIDNYDGTNFKATPVGDDKGSVGVTFKWTKDGKDDTLTVLTVTKDTFINLPTQVNGTNINYWYDGTSSSGTGEGMSPVNNPFMVTKEVTLVAQLTDKVDKMVTGVKAVDISNSNAPITAVLSGGTIDLSGAVKTTSTTGNMKLSFEVDGKYDTTEQSVNVGWDSVSGKIVLSGAKGDGVTLPTLQSNQVKVYDTIYTVTGTGLKAMVSKVELGALDDGVIVVPHVSAGMSGSFTELGKDMKASFEDSTKSSVDFSGADGLKAALNALIAGLSQSSVDGYINQARTAMVQYNNRTKEGGRNNWAASDFSGYDTLMLTPYLEISCSNPTITGDGSNTILTLTITLKARYTVVQSADKTKVAFKDKDKNGNYVNWEAAANINAGEDCGQVDIELTMAGANKTLTFADAQKSYAHHDGQVFEISWKTGVGTISCTNGFVNKTFAINNTAPIAAVGTGAAGKFASRAAFDNLQDAVDAVKNSEVIEVSDNFNGAITVTGAARKFTVRAVGGKTVTLTAVNGANVTSEFKQSSNEYEIQLAADNYTNARITMNTAGNGTASVSTTSAKPGSSVSGTYKANNGYKAGSFTATAQPGNKSVSVSVSANGTFSFTVPSDATSVTVTPSFVLDNGLPFTDVANNAWYFTAVKYCYDTTNNGYRLMEGDSAATFAPNGSFTRAHMVQILWNMKGRPTPKTTANPFRDMSSSNWYYSAVLWAYENGYAKGYPDGTFKPGQAVTRQEMVQFLYQASGSRSGSGNLSYYSDGYTANNWAQPALRWATGLGILSGQNSASLGNTLAPRAVAKRCEVAVTVMNFDKLNLF